MSVRGVITSRTGRTLKVMTPPTSCELVVGAESDRGALAPDGAQVGGPRGGAGGKQQPDARGTRAGAAG